MKTMTGGVLVAALSLALGGADLDAQQGRRGQRMMGPEAAPGPGIERIMSLQDRLELTGDQLQQLDALRQTSVARRTAHMAQMEELRSQLEAGQIRRSEVMAAMEAHREQSEGLREAHRQQVESILTEAQRESLQELGQRGRAFRAGRAMGMRRGHRGHHDGPAFRGRAGPGRDGMPTMRRRGGGFGIGPG